MIILGKLAALFLENRKIGVDALEGAGPLGPVTDNVGAEHEVLLDRHAGERFLALCDLGQTASHDLVGPESIDAFSVEGDRAAPGLDQPGGRLE
jgi:hypothetical protein